MPADVDMLISTAGKYLRAAPALHRASPVRLDFTCARIPISRRRSAPFAAPVRHLGKICTAGFISDDDFRRP
jgi:hypothetical protein